MAYSYLFLLLPIITQQKFKSWLVANSGEPSLLPRRVLEYQPRVNVRAGVRSVGLSWSVNKGRVRGGHVKVLSFSDTGETALVWREKGAVKKGSPGWSYYSE